MLSDLYIGNGNCANTDIYYKI